MTLQEYDLYLDKMERQRDRSLTAMVLSGTIFALAVLLSNGLIPVKETDMFHKVVLIGRLGGDPEMRYTPGGVPVTNFSVATSTKISKENTPECPDGWKEAYNGKAWELTTWFRVTAWRGLAETVNAYLGKGRQVYIEGELGGTTANGSRYPRVWTGNDGVPRASFEITARVVKFLGGNGGGNGDSAPQQDEPPPGHAEENEIPF